MPCAVDEQAFIGGVDKVGVAVNGIARAVVAFDDAQIGEHLADVAAFGGGLGKVVRAAGGDKRRGAGFIGFQAAQIGVGGVVAVAFKAFGEAEIGVAIAGEVPRGGKRGGAAAEYQRFANVFAAGGGVELPVAQHVGKRQADFVYADAGRTRKIAVAQP